MLDKLKAECERGITIDRPMCIRAASPSKLEAAGSESTRAAAAVRSPAVALGTVGGNCWLQHAQLVDIRGATSEEGCELVSGLDSDETNGLRLVPPLGNLLK